MKKVLGNHKFVLTSFGIDASDDEIDLLYINWIPKLKKSINTDVMPVQQIL